MEDFSEETGESSDEREGEFVVEGEVWFVM